MRVLKDNHPTLLKRCVEVNPSDIPAYAEFIEEMIQTMYDHNGVGLSANQVEYTMRIMVIDASGKREQLYVLINPEIVDHSSTKGTKPEGCLSYPNHYVQKERYDWVRVKYLNQAGVERIRRFRGTSAIIIQHELDHLNGIPFIKQGDRVLVKEYRKEQLTQEG